MTRVAVIGGGAAGTLQALHLLRAGVDEVTLIERERAPGRGVAYSTGRPEHLLNVPARRMSAYGDDPDHFVRWFSGRAGGGEEDFAPRMLYGDYLVELLGVSPVEIVRGEAVGIEAARGSARRGRPGRGGCGRAGARQFQAGDAARSRSGRPGRALGRGSVGGRHCRGARRGRRGTAARHRPHRRRRGADPRRDRLCRPHGRSVAARAGAARPWPARADGGAAGGSAAVLHCHASPGAGAHRGDRLAQRGARIALGHLKALGERRPRRAPSLPAPFAALVGRPSPQGRAGGRSDDRGDAGRRPADDRRRQIGCDRGRGRPGGGALPLPRRRRGRDVAGGADRQLHRAGDRHRAGGRALLDALLADGHDPAGPTSHRRRRRCAIAGPSGPTARRASDCR